LEHKECPYQNCTKKSQKQGKNEEINLLSSITKSDGKTKPLEKAVIGDEKCIFQYDPKNKMPKSPMENSQSM
jgi:hypothetical protein